MGNLGKFTKKQSCKTYVSLYFCFDFSFGDETYSVDGETYFLGLPVFLRAN